MKRLIAIILLCGVVTLTGCDEIRKTDSLSFTDIKANTATMSAEEKENYIYEYITDRLTIDLEKLNRASVEDEKTINALLGNIQGDLIGQSKGTIGVGVANYLQHEFSRTPHVWGVNKVEILGYDPATRYYFVDVTYRTQPGVKSVVPVNSIVKGEPNEEGRLQERHTDYMGYLSARLGNRAGVNELLAKFTSRWGDIGAVVASQQDKLLTERVQKGVLGGVGYQGTVDTSIKEQATMNVRYVLSYTYNVGQVTGLAVEHVYLKDYYIDNVDTVERRLRGDTQGTEIIESTVDKVINSYHRSVESNNLQGLYNVFDNFKLWDKYYDDTNTYSYHKYLGYDYEIINSNNGNVDVLVTRGRKSRAKGSDMSSPVYTEKVLLRMKVTDTDSIKIVEEILLKRELIGEPTSVIKDVTGVSEKMLFTEANFTQENQKAVEQLIKDFSDSQVRSTKTDLKYMDYIDVAINQNMLNNMVSSMDTFENIQEKVTWLTGYEAKSNVFCSVKLREVYKTGSGTYDTEVVLDIAFNDGKWGIVGYTRVMNVQLENGVAVDMTGAFHRSVK